ncbi:hypothetical protein HMPREF1384_02384 [Staphylococcus aureus subsp. aureus CM05]|nr:hypothetical protein HMPREF1384_02384 [Staphylococcus aureus subsp. aureus CM05]
MTVISNNKRYKLLKSINTTRISIYRNISNMYMSYIQESAFIL